MFDFNSMYSWLLNNWQLVLIDVVLAVAAYFALRFAFIRFRRFFSGAYVRIQSWLTQSTPGRIRTGTRRWFRLVHLRRYRQVRYGYVKTHPEVYFLVLAVTAVLYLAAGTACLWAHLTIPRINHPLNVGVLIYIFGIAHFASGFRVVDRTHVGGVFVLGIPTIEITGFFLIVLGPDFLMKFGQVELAPIDISVPSAPEKVWRGRDDKGKPLPIPRDSDYEEPIRIVFADEEYSTLNKRRDPLRNKVREDDPLLRSQTQEVEYIVRMAVLPSHYFDFVVKVKDYKNARVQIRGIGVAKINEDFTKICVRRASVENDKYNGLLQRHLANEVRGWGVAIINAKIRLLLSYSMNKAIEGIPEAEAQGRAEAQKAYGQKDAAKTLSEGERIRLTNEGQGRAAAETAHLDAVTQGLKRRMGDLALEGSDVLGAETASVIGQSDSDKLVLGAAGLVEAIGLGKAVGSAVRPTQPAQ